MSIIGSVLGSVASTVASKALSGGKKKSSGESSSGPVVTQAAPSMSIMEPRKKDDSKPAETAEFMEWAEIIRGVTKDDV